MLILSIAVAYLMIKVIKLDRKQIISLAELKERYWLRLVIIYSLIGFQILNFNQKFYVITYGLIAFINIVDASQDRKLIKKIEEDNKEEDRK